MTRILTPDQIVRWAADLARTKQTIAAIQNEVRYAMDDALGIDAALIDELDKFDDTLGALKVGAGQAWRNTVKLEPFTHAKDAA